MFGNLIQLLKKELQVYKESGKYLLYKRLSSDTKIHTEIAALQKLFISKG